MQENNLPMKPAQASDPLGIGVAFCVDGPRPDSRIDLVGSSAPCRNPCAGGSSFGHWD